MAYLDQIETPTTSRRLRLMCFGMMPLVFAGGLWALAGGALAGGTLGWALSISALVALVLLFVVVLGNRTVRCAVAFLVTALPSAAVGLEMLAGGLLV